MQLTNRGASMMEMLFAMAVAALAMPFAYRQVANTGESLKTMETAKRIIHDNISVKNYMRLNSAEFPLNEVLSVETEDPDKKVYISKTETETAAFITEKNRDGNMLWAHRVAEFIGPDAGVVESDGAAYSAAGNWAVSIEGFRPGDIVYKIEINNKSDETEKYLHRTVLSEGVLSTMKRDLSMGNFSIRNIGNVMARKLGGTNLSAYFIKTPVIATEAVYFEQGLNLNPEQSIIPNMRVTGDVVGFRNLWTDGFESRNGSLTADRATITDTLTVSNKFEVKAPYQRTVSGFAGVSAASARTSYLDTDSLTFLPGFGITVSSELLYSATPPVKLGGWSFPNTGGIGPKFNSLKLANFGNKKISATAPDFSDILREGWR